MQSGEFLRIYMSFHPYPRAGFRWYQVLRFGSVLIEFNFWYVETVSAFETFARDTWKKCSLPPGRRGIRAILLKWVVSLVGGVRTWAGFIGLKVGSSGGMLWTGHWNSRFLTRSREGVAKRLSYSQKRLPRGVIYRYNKIPALPDAWIRP